MELKKGRYKQAEVKKILDACISEYNDKINQLNDRLVELKQENLKLSTELSLCKDKEELISSTLKNAEKQALKQEKSCNLQCQACYEELRNFSDKWAAYFKWLNEKYPYYQAVKQSQALKSELDLILNKKENKKSIARLNSELKKANDNFFDPKQKIQDYIAATSDNGFNLDEVLNPGELELEDLCKELGLLEENE